jgi:Zn-dependent protease
VNFNNLKNKKYGILLVAAAGPVSNFITAIFSAVVLQLLSNLSFNDVRIFNIFQPITYMFYFSVQINIALGIFNLIPILPLDGGRILQALLPPDRAIKFSRLEPYGIIIVVLLLMTNVVNYFIVPIIHFLVKLLV